MRKTTMAQVVEFAGQLNVTLQNISEDENTHGLTEAYNRQLIEQAKDHTTIRLAQAMNRAWAELTVVEGLDRLARPQSKDE